MYDNIAGAFMRLCITLVVVMGLAVLINRSCSCSEAAAEGVVGGGGANAQGGVMVGAEMRARVVGWYTYKDGALPVGDVRHELVEVSAKAIGEAAELYGLDWELLAACAYAESSYDPRAVGKVGEVGLLQVHGPARRSCVKSGLDLTEPRGQVLCGARWLSLLAGKCGAVVADPELCSSRTARDGARARACSGGLAAYLSGSCEASPGVGRKVAYRLRLVEAAQRHTSPRPVS